jgi:hypothetical protein
MRWSLLFWGFQDLNFVSDIAGKARSTLNICDFYVQINDAEKTTSVMDLHPEEIIRSKFDFINLHQWLLKKNNKSVIVLVNIYEFIRQSDLEENYLSLKKILSLEYKMFFLFPKLTYPENFSFLNNIYLSSVNDLTKDFSKRVKNFYEIILNSNSEARIINAPISENIILNRSKIQLFCTKSKFNLNFLPKILKKYFVSYISKDKYASDIVNAIKFFLSNLNDCQLIFELTADKSNFDNLKSEGALNKIFPIIGLSLDVFFKLKRNTKDEVFLLWLIYISISNYEYNKNDFKESESLAKFFFSNTSQESL